MTESSEGSLCLRLCSSSLDAGRGVTSRCGVSDVVNSIARANIVLTCDCVHVCETDECRAVSSLERELCV